MAVYMLHAETSYRASTGKLLQAFVIEKLISLGIISTSAGYLPVLKRKCLYFIKLTNDPGLVFSFSTTFLRLPFSTTIS